MPITATGAVAEPRWTSREELELVFGLTAVLRWADVENKGDAVYVERKIQWACDLGTVDAKSWLVGSPAGEIGNAPENLRYAATQLAGLRLYGARGVHESSDDKDGRNRMLQHKKDAELFFRRVHAGIIRLATDAPAGNVPVVYSPLTSYLSPNGPKLTPEETQDRNDQSEKSNVGQQRLWHQGFDDADVG